ncbi:pleckstrin homology domain-containing family S member 1-like isoform X2 [Neoarius graeffei]|uniref:pleckstrin homology domain-containing family S member 1-like isoform X2 n=1 Tax=Neoarius graeffei TaxID=443677 RepID=UPI00298C9AE3|nr:pleckstrin homology domain-containing family S member 1-like isoform X2 [Neoarius graeffei]
MFSKLKKSANPASRFYEVPANTEVVRCGYMYKSPSQNLLSRSLKSWKRRFFVLSKMPINHYELKFFKDESRREKPLGQIQLYQVSLFFRHADSHPIWPWIQRNFRCSASCVLYMRVQEREYFLIGENSCEMDSWFDAIFKALNTPCASQPDSEDIRNRSMSEPLNVLHHDQKEPGDQEQNETDPKPSSFSRQSAPTFINMQRSHYDYPKNYMMTSQSLESEDTDDDEEDETINKDSEAEEDNSYYMDMESVREVIKQTQQEDVLFPQTNRIMHPAKLVQEWSEGHDKEFKALTWSSKFLGSQPHRASLDCAGQTSPIHGGPTTQLTGLNGSVTNVLVPDTTEHLQRSCGVNRSELFWQHKGDLHNIKQLVLMLWLIDIYLQTVL